MSMPATRRPARDWMALGWLLFLVYPVAGFVLQPRRVEEGLWFWGVLLAFVALYVASQWRRGGDDAAWALAGYAGGLLAFVALFPLLGAAACSFLIYGSFLVGNQPDRARALGLSGLSALLLLGLTFWYFPRWGGQPWAWAVPTGVRFTGTRGRHVGSATSPA